MLGRWTGGGRQEILVCNTHELVNWPIFLLAGRRIVARSVSDGAIPVFREREEVLVAGCASRGRSHFEEPRSMIAVVSKAVKLRYRWDGQGRDGSPSIVPLAVRK